MEYVTSIKYLGTTISSEQSFSFKAADDLRNFYRSANSILNTLEKPNEYVLMYLLYTNCVPTLSYACAVKTFSSREMTDCNTALNDAIRKIFTYNRWESVRFLRKSFGYRSLYEIFALAKTRFDESLPSHCNAVIRHIHLHISVEQ